MFRWVLSLLLSALTSAAVAGEAGEGTGRSASPGKAYVIPIQEDINPPLVYIIRRGVKEAMEAGATAIVLDMNTHGGRLDVTEEIIGILSRFKGRTITFVNDKAFSAGAFIAVATQEIYMAEEAVIGAATPIMLVPGGGPVELPESVEAKMTSGVKALIRAKAEKNGHNVDVIEAMIDRQKELTIDGKTINPKGQILTLTSSEAAQKYGDPPRPLLSAGTFPDRDSLLKHLGYDALTSVEVKPTGVERIAFWLNTISPVLLALGLIGIYMEFKTPGFGVPGIIAIVSLSLYFLGGYIAGLSGIEWIAVFAIGVILIVLEIIFFPGTLALGLTGALLVLVSLVMGATDLYPGAPTLPGLPELRLPFRNLAFAAVITVLGIWALGSMLPRTPAYRMLVSEGTSGGLSDTERDRTQTAQLNWVGVATSALLPGGKARFEGQILDVVSQGEMIPKGARVRIIGHTTGQAIVEQIGDPPLPPV